MPDGLASTILTKCDPHWGHISTMSKIGRLPLERQLASSPSPDHFIFTGSQVQQFAQVGNAVPPLLAEAVGLALKSILEEGN